MPPERKNEEEDYRVRRSPCQNKEDVTGHTYQCIATIPSPIVVGIRIVNICTRCGNIVLFDVEMRDHSKDINQMPLPGMGKSS